LGIPLILLTGVLYYIILSILSITKGTSQ